MAGHFTLDDKGVCRTCMSILDVSSGEPHGAAELGNISMVIV